jgi:hypothetical protein
MTGHEWVVLVPVLLLLAPLVLELIDLLAARKDRGGSSSASKIVRTRQRSV